MIALRERLVFGHLGGIGLRERRIGKHGLELVARDDEIDGDSLVVLVAEHFDHMARRRRVAIGKSRNRNSNNSTICNFRMLCKGRENVMPDERVDRLDHAERLSTAEIADKLVMRPLDNAQHTGRLLALAGSLASMRPLDRRDFHHVIGKRAAHLLARDEVFALGCLHEAIASAPHVDAPARITARRATGV